ncbi:MAG TPA: hypothetical protein VNC78_10195 [Actinomycetota bacterium]|nr:hypothetical protein [Actinomycetota bacterium]
MGARLSYAKVIDRDLFFKLGAKVHPGLDNDVILPDEPGKAGVFLVIRGWVNDHGTFTEQWRIEGPAGGVVYESLPRELHLATPQHIERLEDEIADLEFDYASDDYAVVFVLDESEVARVRFSVKFPQQEAAGRR